MRLKQAGKEADVKAMIQLGNTLMASQSAGDKVKMRQLDQNTALWGIDEGRRQVSQLHTRQAAHRFRQLIRVVGYT